ncbi:MAG: hypothetical protein WCD70_00540 [Alphaproteobacteria bacterium]
MICKFVSARSIIINGTLILLLTGCGATTAQLQFQNMHQTTAAAATELKSCMSEVWDSPENAPVRDHEPLDIRDVTLDQEMDKSKVTPKEIVAIKAIYPKLTDCQKAGLTKIDGVMPSIAAILANEIQKGQQHLLPALLRKEITWGTYTTNRKEVFAEGGVLLAAEYQRIASGLEQSHEAELARRQALMDAIIYSAAVSNASNQAAFSNQNAAMNANMPHQTTCMNMGGGMVSCQ